MSSEMAVEEDDCKRKPEDKDFFERNEVEEDWEEYDDEDGPDDDDDDQDSDYEVEESQVTVKGQSPPRLLTLRLAIENDDHSEQWMHTINVSCKYEGKIVCNARGQHIKRDMIRASFYHDMDASTQDKSRLAREIFDRYGCLKKELMDHPVLRGSGAWGSELDIGNLFFIEYIRVDVEWRRLGLATDMTRALMRKAESLYGGVSFSLTMPGSLNEEIERERTGKSRKEYLAIHYRHFKAALAFWRSLGFRRVGASACFGFATNTSHAAHKISPAEDYDTEEISQHEVRQESDEDDSDDDNPWNHEGWMKRKERALQRMKKTRPVHHAITTLPDAQCVNFFISRMIAEGPADPAWTKVDSSRENVLHFAARLSKPQAVVWLMNNVDTDKNLRLARNLDGYTPLEALQETLEASRNGQRRICMSDKFRGYSPDSVSCMGSLEEMSVISEIQALRLKFGCTCGGCLMGFMSPRMKYTLLAHTKKIYKVLSDDFFWEEPWCEFNESHVHHLGPDLQQNIRNIKLLRNGFVHVFHHIASCLCQNVIPTEANVRQIWRISGEWPPVTNIFFAMGGNAEMALRKLFDDSRDQDDKAGNGAVMKSLQFKNDILALPECRNDHEFGFVALACGLDDTSPLDVLEQAALRNAQALHDLM